VRGLTSTVVLGVALVVLATYIVLVDSRTPVGNDASGPPVFELSVDEILEITVTALDGSVSRLHRDNDAWRLVEPMETKADAAAVSSIAGSLASLEVQRVVAEESSELQQYALEPPRLEIAFRTEETGVQRLQIGGATPAGDNLYARLADEGAVFLISSFLEGTFNRTPFDLRDKRVLVFDAAATDSFSVISADTTRQFTREAGVWSIAAPVETRGDHAAIDALLTSLSSARMQATIAEAPEDLAAYGLDAPTLTATTLTDGAAATLLFGIADDSGTVYAKDMSRPVIFTVPASLVDGLVPALVDLRNRNVFDIRASTAERLEILRDGETVVIERATVDAEEALWRNAEGAEVATDLADTVLTALANLRASVFQDEPHAALERPALTVTARFDGGRSETVTFAQEGDDVFVRRADEPGSVRLELTTRFKALLDALDTLS
jgi:hypothetical protein